MEREINAKTAEHGRDFEAALREAEEFLTNDEATQLAQITENRMEVTALERIFQKTDPQKLWSPTILEKPERPQPGISQTHIGRYWNFILPGEQAISLPYGLEAVRTYDGVILRKKIQQKPEQKGERNRKFPSSHIGRGGNTVWPVYDQSFSYSGEKILEKKSIRNGLIVIK